MFFKLKKEIGLTDLELLQKYKVSYETSYAGVLFSRYSHLAFGVCMKYLKNEEESRDAVMSIFEKLLEDLKKHEITNFKSWLHSVARNHCLMELRTQKSKSSKEENSELFMKSGYFLHLPTETDEEFNLQSLDDCIKQLVKEQKKCVELFYLEEKCYKEITEILGYTLNEVKSFIQNGKRNLKNCMGRRNND